MNKLTFFLFIGLLFIVERIFQTFFVFPVFIFPIFAILFILHSKDEMRDTTRILLASIFFDFFSGFYFGVYGLAIFAVCLTIYFFKSRLNISAKSFLFSIILSVVFVFEFFLILSANSFTRALIRQSVGIVSETVILAFSLVLVLNKVNFFTRHQRKFLTG